MLVRQSLLDYDLKELTLNELIYRVRFLLKYSDDKKELAMLQKEIAKRTIKDPIATFLPNPKLLTISPQSIGPIIVANLPTVEYKP